MLAPHHIAIVQSTLPLLESAGSALTEHFYARMFRENPELKEVFNLSHQHSGQQPVALFNAIFAYARYIDNPGVLAQAVERIAQKHTGFLIRPEQYDIVGHHLLETLRELAPDAATPEVLEAWEPRTDSWRPSSSAAKPRSTTRQKRPPAAGAASAVSAWRRSVPRAS
ncbi:globin domain-containing protein [Marinobacterium aestuariivivens]|uniref:Globin domain-containing protein n=1 Tax=Marinobacterium aestuariivivens TaxID=1698799 RepID=A0ABW1ZW22_9GAMM